VRGKTFHVSQKRREKKGEIATRYEKNGVAAWRDAVVAGCYRPPY